LSLKITGALVAHQMFLMILLLRSMMFRGVTLVKRAEAWF